MPISQTCLPKIKHLHNEEMDIKSIFPIKPINDLEDIVADFNITNHLYDYYTQKQLKNEACHACPEFKSTNCTIFNENLRCLKPKIWYHRGDYCLHAKFACNHNLHALQGRLIDKNGLNDDYADPSEDDTKHETYGVHQLHRLDKSIEYFPIRNPKLFILKRLHCMSDKRWYYRSNEPDIIIRVDQIFCLYVL